MRQRIDAKIAAVLEFGSRWWDGKKSIAIFVKDWDKKEYTMSLGKIFLFWKTG